MTADLRECPYCAETHGTALLCAPARRVLDALVAQGQRFDMPTVEFPESPVHADAFGGDSVLCAQIVVKAAIVPVAGVSRPVLIFTGRDLDQNVLPQWIYPGDDDALNRIAGLVSDMTALAIRTARDQRKAVI